MNAIITVYTTPCTGHMEKQEMEMKWKLEMETGNGNWKRKRKLKTEMETQLLRFNCCYPSALSASSFCYASLASFPDL